jgi:hypothetical protein
MRIVPLKEYSKPRILLVDFDKKDVAKVIDAGFDAKRAYSGLYDSNEFCIPCEAQDIEVCLLRIGPKTFSNLKERKKAESSVSDNFSLYQVLKEIWERYGWSIIFVKAGTDPEDLEHLGISDIGYVDFQGRLLGSSNQVRRSFRVKPFFPKFRGETVNENDKKIGSLLLRFSKSVEWILFAVDERVRLFGGPADQAWPITDNAASPNALSVMFYGKFSIAPTVVPRVTGSSQTVDVELPQYSNKGILVLPDFGDNDIEIGINLINDFIYSQDPMLFDVARHEWLIKYRPSSIRVLQEAIEDREAIAKQEIAEIQAKIEEEEKKYSWLNLLLIGMDDEFKQAVAEALSFIGYRVEDVDEKIGQGQRKKEDLRITEPVSKAFYLVEAKSTKRGASEDLITKTQTHQSNYSREQKCTVPNAILVINHSVNLDPGMREGRFYRDKAILDRLRELNIKAIDSVVLHSLCQTILEDESKREEIRLRIENEDGVISGKTF